MTTEAKPIANPNVDGNTRADDDPYVIGWNEGKKFAEERAANIARLGPGAGLLSCVIDREVWNKANAVWQEHNKAPEIYVTPEELLRWFTYRLSEMKYFNTFAEGQGYTKGFLAGKGLKVKTGQL